VIDVVERRLLSYIDSLHELHVDDIKTKQQQIENAKLLWQAVKGGDV
jgi:hypothetical protein